MDYSLLAKHIRMKVDLSDNEMDIVTSYFTPKELTKKTILFREGNITDEMAFVVNGCLRAYYVDDNGFEHILHFAPEGWWAADVLSLIKRQKSNMNIESIMDSRVLLLTKTAQDIIFEKVPKMERFFRILAENALCATRQRIIDSMSLTAKQRYANFEKTYPDNIINLIPQKHVAAYIGVTPEFLSKMKNQHLKD